MPDLNRPTNKRNKPELPKAKKRPSGKKRKNPCKGKGY